MSFQLTVGESDFADLRNSKTYYVDKTDIIYELVQNTKNKVTLFTRPRRFGKTLMMSMMENFFSVRKESSSIFEGLSITKHTDFCKSWMNQYPVIFISFKDVDGLNFEKAYAVLKNTISKLCKSLVEILKCENLDKDDIDLFLSLKSKKAPEEDVKDFLTTIMRMLYTVYGKKVILLIDEYDVPLAKASSKGYYDEMLDIIRGIMSTSLKDNEYLQFAVVTGCLRIAKESIFTGTNNFTSYSVLDKKFSSYFGFSKEEVKVMLESFDQAEKISLIKEWYDGYLFGNSYVYCPWDVVSYLSELKDDPTAVPKNYWENTSHNDILLSFAKRRDFSVSSRFETLLNGGVIRQTITDTVTYDSLHSSEDNLWSILLMTGYLTKADPDEQGKTVTLRIPNREISSIFENAVVTLFKETIDTTRQKAMMEALWSGNELKVSEIITQLLKKTISYHDYHEDYYHAFLTGIFVGIGYEVESNKEKGLGRPDIVLLDRDNDRVILIEAKKSLSKSDMEADSIKAASQIIDQEYKQGLDEYDTVLCYGISFFKKQARVKLVYQDESKK